ncbi:hypothetical protein Tco_0794057 [Tanacetum coccineum]
MCRVPEEPEQVTQPSPDLFPMSNERMPDDEIVRVPDPESDPEEDDDEEPEEVLSDYPADGGDDGDDEMDIEEDEDDDMDIETDEEDEDDEMDIEMDEEEHLAPAYPVVDFIPEFHTCTTWFPILSAWEITLAISSPPASPLSPWVLHHTTTDSFIPAEAAATSHSLPLPPPFILSPTRPDAPPPLPTSAPTSFPPLSLPTDSHREGRPEVNLPPRMGLCRRTKDPLLMETEAGMSREAWRRAMDSSDLAHGGVISLRTTVYAQMEEITELQSADRRRQRAMSELLETDRRRREEMRELRAADRTRQQQIVQTLTAMQTLQREMVPLQGLVTTLQGQVMTLQGQVATLQGQQGLAGGPAQPELPEDTGSSS